MTANNLKAAVIQLFLTNAQVVLVLPNTKAVYSSHHSFSPILNVVRELHVVMTVSVDKLAQCTMDVQWRLLSDVHLENVSTSFPNVLVSQLVILTNHSDVSLVNVVLSQKCVLEFFSPSSKTVSWSPTHHWRNRP